MTKIPDLPRVASFDASDMVLSVEGGQVKIGALSQLMADVAAMVPGGAGGGPQPVSRLDVLAQPATSRSDMAQGFESGGTVQSMTCVQAVWVPRTCNSIRLTYASRRVTQDGETAPSGPASGPGGYTLRASLDMDGALWPVWFQGSRQRRLLAGDIVESEPVPVRIVGPRWVKVRTYVQADTLGVKWPIAHPGAVTALGEGVFNGSDLTDTLSLPALSAGFIAGPSAFNARIEGSTKPAVGILGSSSFYGAGDSAEAPTYASGYTSRALHLAGVPHTRMAVGGDSLGLLLASGRWRLEHVVRSGLTHVVLGLGSNDIQENITYAELMRRLNAVLDWCAGLGLKVLLPTYTTRTLSTDGWTTLAGQSFDAGRHAVRTQANEAIRAGLGHPAIAGVLDIAGYLVASGADAGKWRVDLGGPLTADGTHNTQLGHRLGGVWLAAQPQITGLM